MPPITGVVETHSDGEEGGRDHNAVTCDSKVISHENRCEKRSEIIQCCSNTTTVKVKKNKKTTRHLEKLRDKRFTVSKQNSHADAIPEHWIHFVPEWPHVFFFKLEPSFLERTFFGKQCCDFWQREQSGPGVSFPSSSCTLFRRSRNERALSLPDKYTTKK